MTGAAIGPAIRALALLLALACPALATTDDWPALYDVTGVAADDVLNIRAAPDAGSAIVGTLAPDTTGIEVIRPDDRFEWGLVNTAEGTGWISLRYAVPQPGQWWGRIPDLGSCFGTEPFWTLSFEAPRVTLTRPGADPSTGLISGKFGSDSRRDRFAFTGSFLPGDRRLTLSVRKAECRDGMSDRAYGYEVDMLIQQVDGDPDPAATGLFSGCCSLLP